MKHLRKVVWPCIILLSAAAALMATDTSNKLRDRADKSCRWDLTAPTVARTLSDPANFNTCQAPPEIVDGIPLAFEYEERIIGSTLPGIHGENFKVSD